ncbi:PqqD family protein [Streptomyces sp. NPDC056503]|uniref:PqqD family protein n=1 Tax=Streptomyces sp. NPDC056503 TaxID=3345842 RepID=UPI0036825EC3
MTAPETPGAGEVADDWRPTRELGIYTRRSGQKVLIEGYLDVYETDLTGAHIWMLCGTGATVAEITERVATKQEKTVEEVGPVVREFISDLVRCGFVH